MAEGSVARASIEWRAVLGETKVVTDGEVLARYARSTEPDETHPACILYPGVDGRGPSYRARGIGVRHAPIYPISRGKNWGYGDTCAPCDGAAIIDLSRMNRIVEVNTELGYAVIEAGVSQQQLHDYLRSNNTRLWGGLHRSGGGIEPGGEHARSRFRPHALRRSFPHGVRHGGRARRRPRYYIQVSNTSQMPEQAGCTATASGHFSTESSVKPILGLSPAWAFGSCRSRRRSASSVFALRETRISARW